MPIRQPAVLCATLFCALTAGAQVPNKLLHSIPAPPRGVPAAALGYSAATDGGVTVLGAPRTNSPGAEAAGEAKVFDTSTGALLHVLSNPDPSFFDQFGHSAAVSGNRVVIATTANNSGGTVYVYDLAGATPTAPIATLNNPTPELSARFGWSVAISGTQLVVGAPDHSANAIIAGAAYVYDLGSATPDVPAAVLTNPTPVNFDTFGESVTVSGTRIVVGAPGDDTGANNAGSAYVYDLSSDTPTVPAVSLNNPTPASNDAFGTSVAISGTRAAVGAIRDDTGAVDAGSAYVFDLSSDTPSVPVATLNNPDPGNSSPGNSDNFGQSVAIAGTRVVVGIPDDDTVSINAGSVCVYELSSETPTVPIACLNYPRGRPGDNYGRSVSIDGTRLVVGSPYDDTGASSAGSAYLYELSSGIPTGPSITFSDPGLAPYDEFGVSMAISGKLLVVGAYQDDTGATDAGSAYVYDLSSDTPTVPVLMLNNPAPAPQDYFAWSVGISGTRLVVGASRDDTGAMNAGSAYVYDLNSAVPTVPVVTLNNPGPVADDNFGRFVAISGTSVVVGAYLDDTGASNAGSVYVYDLNSGTPGLPVVTLNNPEPTANEWFGRPVSISGTRLVVGAYPNNFGSPGAASFGSAYVYDLNSVTPVVPEATLKNPGGAYDYFGRSVAISGRYVAIGAYDTDSGASGAGAAYVYDLHGATPEVPAFVFNNPAPAAMDGFGYSVAISGPQIVVGAHRDDTGADDSGSAYVYDLTSATPANPVAILNNPAPAPDDRFGWSVAVDGGNVVVGAPFDDTVFTDKGFAYVFGPNPLDLDGGGLLDSWELTYWPTTTGHSAEDDFDHDGYSELLELALGLNPTAGDPGGLPPATVENNYLTLTVAKRPGVTYEAQSAGTLLPAQPDSFSAASTRVVIDNPTTLVVRDNVVSGTASTRFIRLKVTAAP